MKSLKKCLPDILAVILFAVLAYAYFFPAVTEGRILYRHDSAASKGMGQEMSEYRQRTGETTRWTNALFGGMPTYQMSPAYDSGKVLDQVANAYHLWLPDYVWYLFAYMLGFYIYGTHLFRCYHTLSVIQYCVNCIRKYVRSKIIL